MKLIKTIAAVLLVLSVINADAQEATPEKKLIPVQDIMDYAFKSSRVVMMNEAHAGQKRNIRTRIIGQLILPKAHSHGVRILAMEALTESFAKEANSTRKLPEDTSGYGYLHQPELRDMMQYALDLGWDLVAYEADTKIRPEMSSSIDRGNWREQRQAENLSAILDEKDENTKILVWCGNSHHSKEPGSTPGGTLYPMGYQFWQLTNIEPFIIDQIVTVDFTGDNSRFQKWIDYELQLKNNYSGTLGFINTKDKSATIISLHNTLE